MYSKFSVHLVSVQLNVNYFYDCIGIFVLENVTLLVLNINGNVLVL